MQEFYLQLQNLKRTDKYSLLLIAAMAVCLAIKLLALDPLQNKIIQTQAAIIEEQQRLDNYRAFVDTYRNYEVFAAQQTQTAEVVYKIMPDELAEPELIKEYTELASKYDLHVQSIKPVQPSENSKTAYAEKTFKIVLNGNFYKAAAFLNELENQERLVTTANVVIERSTEGLPGSVLLTADLTAYSLK